MLIELCLPWFVASIDNMGNSIFQARTTKQKSFNCEPACNYQCSRVGRDFRHGAL